MHSSALNRVSASMGSSVNNTLISTRKRSNNTSISRAKTNVLEKWVQTSFDLHKNPTLVTMDTLIDALKNHPPISVVNFMLTVNPGAAEVPHEGMSPLQVAVQHHNSVEVVECVLRACPFALCVTNAEFPEDPLSFAKRFRKAEPELIRLLSYPLTHWISENIDSERRDAVTKHSSDDNYSARIGPEVDSRNIERQESQNVKKLCAHLLRGQKKLTHQIGSIKRELDLAQIHKSEALHAVREEQKKGFFHQMVALDMKERAMTAKLKRTEKILTSSCKGKMESWQQEMVSWRAITDDRLREVELVVDNETRQNDKFRHDLSEWMEEQAAQSSITPFVFATPLGKMDDTMPLYSKEHASQCPRKRLWSPLFCKKDHILLKDDEG